MKVKIAADQLYAHLKRVGLAVAKGERAVVLPILSNVLLECEQGNLKISASNIGQAISISIPATQVEAGSVAIPYKEFSKLIASYHRQPVTLISSNTDLRIIGDTESILDVIQNDVFARRDETTPDSVIATFESNDLAATLGATLFSSLKPGLECNTVWFVFDPQSCLVATENVARYSADRLAYKPGTQPLSTTFDPQSCLVADENVARYSADRLDRLAHKPGTQPLQTTLPFLADSLIMLKTLLGSIRSTVQLSYQDSLVTTFSWTFSGITTRFTALLYLSRSDSLIYPMPTEPAPTSIVLNVSQTRAILKALVVATNTEYVQLELSSNCATFTSWTLKETVSVVALEFSGSPLRVALNVRWLLELLTALRELDIKQVRLSCAGMEKPVVFSTSERPGFSHLIMPLRQYDTVNRFRNLLKLLILSVYHSCSHNDVVNHKVSAV